MKVNEIFYSIQGEGRWSGTPMVFVRFAGCNLKCHFCDTVHEPYTEMTIQNIIDEIKKYPTDRVCLTGGEPGLQITDELIRILHDNSKIVHVETNGTIILPEQIDWITISPKNDNVRLKKADEIKLVYEGQNVQRWIDFPAKYFFLQPCSMQNTEKVIEYVLTNPKWNISIQTQKIISIR